MSQDKADSKIKPLPLISLALQHTNLAFSLDSKFCALPDNKFVCFLYHKDMRKKHIGILSQVTLKISDTIHPLNENSDMNMAVMSGRWLISSECCGRIYIRDLQKKNLQNAFSILGDSKAEGLSVNIKAIETYPESQKLISLHSMSDNQYELAIWDMQLNKLLKKIRLSMPGYFHHLSFLNENEVLVVFSTLRDTLSFISIHLLDCAKTNLFVRENVNFIYHIDTSMKGIISFVEVTEHFSTYKMIKKSLNSNEERVLFESHSAKRRFPKAPEFFQATAGQAISSLLATPEGYVIGLQDGSINFFSNEDKLVRMVKLDSIIPFYDKKPFELVWNPYNGSVVAFDSMQISQIKTGYKQSYEETLGLYFPPDIVRTITEYAGLFKAPKIEDLERDSTGVLGAQAYKIHPDSQFTK